MRLLLASLTLLLSLAAVADDLTLERALALAKARNGVIAAAQAQAAIARSGVVVAHSAFYPRVTPEYRYTDNLSNGAGGTGTLSFNQVSVRSSWLLLDGGQRGYDVAQSGSLAAAAELSATDTLRQILFGVIQQFLDAMRAQELLKVANAQVVRATETEDVTKQQVELGAAPRKDILQARADLANALVDQITARNAVSTTQASLKAVMGWSGQEAFPTLFLPAEPIPSPTAKSLEEAVDMGLKTRPDLEEARRRLQANRYSVLSAERAASFDWTLNLDYNKIFVPDETDNRSLTFLLSYPLFDAGAARENARQSKLAMDANRSLLNQQVLDIRSEIESAHLTYEQGQERLKAAQAALDAAKENYKAASESQGEGVASVVDVTAAQVALVTAETNYVQALYDSYISAARLRLVCGETLPGEKP